MTLGPLSFNSQLANSPFDPFYQFSPAEQDFCPNLSFAEGDSSQSLKSFTPGTTENANEITNPGINDLTGQHFQGLLTSNQTHSTPASALPISRINIDKANPCAAINHKEWSEIHHNYNSHNFRPRENFCPATYPWSRNTASYSNESSSFSRDSPSHLRRNYQEDHNNHSRNHQMHLPQATTYSSFRESPSYSRPLRRYDDLMSMPRYAPQPDWNDYHKYHNRYPNYPTQTGPRPQYYRNSSFGQSPRGRYDSFNEDTSKAVYIHGLKELEGDEYKEYRENCYQDIQDYGVYIVKFDYPKNRMFACVHLKSSREVGRLRSREFATWSSKKNEMVYKLKLERSKSYVTVYPYIDHS